ncbi:MAG: DNA polymerase I [Clostridiales bacterium]|nr:DNA polymerase I [Clostridiales bacterium]
MRDLFLCVDGNSLMHRAFHALPLMDADGVYTNAVHGFLAMLLKVFKEYSPRYAAVAFDLPAPTFRHKAYDGYKAGRKSTPDELRSQFPLIREILAAMHVGVLTAEGFEADDILGTVAKKCQGSDSLRAMLLTGDKDALQLVDDEVQLLFTRKGISETTLFTPPMVKEMYGISPRQVTDWKGLMGDSSDNIPGVPGVGEKTAVKLLCEYGTLENVLENADRIKGKLGEKIRQNRDQALFSKDLATIRPNAPIPWNVADYELNKLSQGIPLLRKYQLGQILQRLTQLLGDEAMTAPAEAEAPAEQLPAREIADIDALCAFLGAIEQDAPIALHMGENTLSLCTDNAFACLTFRQDLLSPGLDMEETLPHLRSMMERHPLIVHDGKRLMHILRGFGISPPNILFDTMLGAYLLNPQEKSYSLSAFESEDAQGVRKLYVRQSKAIRESGMENLYREVELPLSYVLFDMEVEGFRTDADVLKSLGAQWKQKTETLQQEIYDLCGTRFNINSPKQLGQVLFETLALPHGKKTKSGYSTDADTLESIRDAHPVVDKVLEYRQVVKLSSTYVDALLSKMDANGRIHSFFDQTGTATGRISSSEPNLQNIPVRTEMGREIRRAFIPREGWLLFDADYSQIELRILAHLSGDAAMMDAFLRDQDVHTRTASEVFEVPMEDVTSDMRRSAKAVNFGLVYGISQFGLAKNIGISRREAADFISRYFARYPGVKQFMDDAVKKGYDEGCALTIMGRRRMLPELQSSNQNIRSFGERAAMNTPVQGTAADIIKLSMVRVHRALKEHHLRAKLILQVHDELIIECPKDEMEQVERLLIHCMENAVSLRVPLKVEAKSGESWYETK